jgi:hypothetical protein
MKKTNNGMGVDIELAEFHENPDYQGADGGASVTSMQTIELQLEPAAKKWSWNSCLAWCSGTQRAIPATWAQKYMGAIGTTFFAGTSLVLNYALFSSLGSNVFLLTNNNTTLSNAAHSPQLYFKNSYLKTCVDQLKKDVVFLKAYTKKRKDKGLLQPGEEEQVNALLQDVADIVVVASDESLWNYGKIAIDVVLVLAYIVRCGLYFATQAHEKNNNEDTCPENSESAALLGMDVAMTILSSSLYLWGFKRNSETDIFIGNVSMRVGSLKNELAKVKAGVLDRVMTAANQPSTSTAVENQGPAALTVKDEADAELNLNRKIDAARKDPSSSRQRINSSALTKKN